MIANSVIKLEGVDVYQQKHLVLSNVNLHINPGEFVFLIGQTGSGKSSLLKIIYGDLHISNGNGLVAGFDLKKLTEKDIPFLRRKLGIVFQDFQLLTDRSIEQNLEFVMKATGWKDQKLISERILDVLEKVGLRSKIGKSGSSETMWVSSRWGRTPCLRQMRCTALKDTSPSSSASLRLLQWVEPSRGLVFRVRSSTRASSLATGRKGARPGWCDTSPASPLAA
jgi:ABC-type phosphate transport system ATPase subunit